MSRPLSGGDIQKIQSKPCNILVLPTSFIGNKVVHQSKSISWPCTRFSICLLKKAMTWLLNIITFIILIYIYYMHNKNVKNKRGVCQPIRQYFQNTCIFTSNAYKDGHEFNTKRDRRGRDRMVVGFTTTSAISTNHH